MGRHKIPFFTTSNTLNCFIRRKDIHISKHCPYNTEMHGTTGNTSTNIITNPANLPTSQTTEPSISFDHSLETEYVILPTASKFTYRITNCYTAGKRSNWCEKIPLHNIVREFRQPKRLRIQISTLILSKKKIANNTKKITSRSPSPYLNQESLEEMLRPAKQIHN